MVSDLELVRDRGPLFLQLVPHRPRRPVQILLLHVTCSDPRVVLGGVRSLGAGGRQWLRLLASVPINCHRLDAQLPGLKVSLHDVVHRSVLRKIDRLRYSARDKRLRSCHHPQMPHISDRTCALRRLERAVEHGKMLVLDMRRALNSPSSVDVADDRVRLLMVIPQLEQRRGDGVVDNLNHPPTNQLFILHQCQIRLHTSSVAVHHEAYGSCGS